MAFYLVRAKDKESQKRWREMMSDFEKEVQDKRYQKTPYKDWHFMTQLCMGKPMDFDVHLDVPMGEKTNCVFEYRRFYSFEDETNTRTDYINIYPKSLFSDGFFEFIVRYYFKNTNLLDMAVRSDIDRTDENSIRYFPSFERKQLREMMRDKFNANNEPISVSQKNEPCVTWEPITCSSMDSKNSILWNNISWDNLREGVVASSVNDFSALPKTVYNGCAPGNETIKVDSVSLPKTGTSTYVDTVSSIEKRVDKIEEKVFPKNTTKENEKMEMFKNFDFGKVDSNLIHMSMYGIAVRNSAGTWVAYNRDSGSMMDVDVINVPGEKFMFKVPVALSQVDVGDVIIHNRRPVFVTDITSAPNSLGVVDIYAGEAKNVLPARSMFGFDFVTKVVSLMDMTGVKASAQNPFGNMLPLMFMSDEGMDNDTMMMMLMMGMGMNGGNQMMNMLPFLMMNQKGDNKDKDMGMMMALMAMNGSFMFTQPAPTPVTTPAPTQKPVGTPSTPFTNFTTAPTDQ